jgi:hypothetical protein
MQFDFLTTDIPGLLSRLTPETKPQWGRMSSQNMVEHLSIVMRICNGKSPMQVEITPERIEKSRAFLFGPDALPRDFKISALPADPLPHRFADIPTAIGKLMKEVEDFHSFWKNPPAELPWHPRFGPLNYEEWVVFHNKHFTHHLTQFALLED